MPTFMASRSDVDNYIWKYVSTKVFNSMVILRKTIVSIIGCKHFFGCFKYADFELGAFYCFHPENYCLCKNQSVFWISSIIAA